MHNSMLILIETGHKKPSPEATMITLSVEIDDKTLSALDTLAHARHQTVDTLVKVAIDAFVLREQEDQEDEVRWAEYLSGGGIESARVMDWLDKWSRGDWQRCPQ